MARYEETRQTIIRRARAHVEQLADPELIDRQWRTLLEHLAARGES